MEIARLEVSTQRHIDKMQVTAKVMYGKKFHYLQTFVGDVEKAPEPEQDCNAVEAVCRGHKTKGHLEKVSMKA